MILINRCCYGGCQNPGEYDVTRFDEKWRGTPLYCKTHAIIVCQELHKLGGKKPAPWHGKTDYLYRRHMQ